VERVKREADEKEREKRERGRENVALKKDLLSPRDMDEKWFLLPWKGRTVLRPESKHMSRRT
jgi:hypothetical protein